MRSRTQGFALLVLVGVLAGCATTATNPDPWESVNRPVFRFNDGFDRWVLDPLATGWSFITPKAFRFALDRFLRNAAFPVRFVSNLGAGRFRRASEETERFVMNTTLGLAGLFDPATARWQIETHPSDMGLMFGRWGIPPGPYWMIPIVGPSNPRDALGYAAVSAAESLLTVVPLGPIRQINARAIDPSRVDLAREAALDFYVFVRDAYVERRLAQVRDVAFEEGGLAGGDDFYEIDEGLYDLPEIEEEPY